MEPTATRTPTKRAAGPKPVGAAQGTRLDPQMRLVAGRLVRERGATPPALAIAFGISTKVAADIARRALAGLADE